MRKPGAVLGLMGAAALSVASAHAQFTRHWTTTLPFHNRVDAIAGAPATPNDDMRGIAFNKNPASPYYGYAYVCFLTTATPSIVRYDKIAIYKPDTSAADHGVPSYVDTGLRITSPGTTANGAFGVDVGSDDTVWLVDYSGRKVLKAPPVPASPDTEVAASVVINLADYDSVAKPMLPSGFNVGNPRAIVVSGTAANATVLACNNSGGTSRSIEKFTVNGSAVTFNWAYAPLNPTGNTYNQNNSCVDAALDAAGNVYVPLAARADLGTADVTIVKLNSAGAVDTSFAPTAPIPAGPADYPAIAWVPNSSAPGGGYLFWQGARGGNNTANVYQYDMTGALVDAYGVDAANNPLGLGKRILGVNIVEVFSADGEGNLYQRYGTGANNGNIYRISQSPPAINAGDYKKSAPTVHDGIVYFGSNDGNLYGVDSTTGMEAEGFPVNIPALTGDPGSMVLGRPSVRGVGGQEPALYVTTNTGRVARIPMGGTSGSGSWVSAPLVTATDVKVTPAVADTGVYVAMADGASASLFKLDLNTGATLYQTPLAGATKVQSSVSAFNGNLYVGTDAKAYRVTDDGSAFVVQADVGGNTPGSPFVDNASPSGPTMYTVDAGGTVYAKNATTFNAVASFGGGQVMLVGDTGVPSVSTGPYALQGVVYVGANDNKVYALNAADGTGAGPGGSMQFFDANAVGIPVTESVPGGWRITSDVAAAPAEHGGFNIVFGSRNGLYYQVAAGNPSEYHVTVVGNVNRFAVDSAPAIDRATGSEFVGVDSGFIMKVAKWGMAPR